MTVYLILKVASYLIPSNAVVERAHSICKPVQLPKFFISHVFAILPLISLFLEKQGNAPAPIILKLT
jgi:hypothetical protein